MKKAIAYFQQVLVVDPGYAAAYAGLAYCYYGVSKHLLSSNRSDAEGQMGGFEGAAT